MLADCVKKRDELLGTAQEDCVEVVTSVVEKSQNS